jgi:hypothetical protein
MILPFPYAGESDGNKPVEETLRISRPRTSAHGDRPHVTWGTQKKPGGVVGPSLLSRLLRRRRRAVIRDAALLVWQA